MKLNSAKAMFHFSFLCVECYLHFISFGASYYRIH